MRLQEGERAVAQVGAGLDAEPRHLRAVTGPTPWKRLTGSEATNAAPLCRRDDAQAVGLVLVGGELGDELVVGDARPRR